MDLANTSMHSSQLSETAGNTPVPSLKRGKTQPSNKEKSKPSTRHCLPRQNMKNREINDTMPQSNPSHKKREITVEIDTETETETDDMTRPSTMKQGDFNNNDQKISISDSTASILYNSQSPTDDALKLVIVCVGLPARGKSYITKKLQRYLNWMQYNTKIFNVGNTRRQMNVYIPSNYPVQGPTVDHSTPMQSPTPSEKKTMDDAQDDPLHGHDANLFDHTNKQNVEMREQWAKETLNQLLDFLLSHDGNVGMFDATNTTKARRKWIVETINKRTKGLVKILFLESICTDFALIEKNIRLKLSGPDYKKMDPQKALQDFRNRLKNYEKVYETIDEAEEAENEKYDIQYVKIINAGKKVIAYNISGYLSSQCVFFLLNFNLADRQIWLTANGESVYNVQNQLGGDSDLTKNGIQFAKALPKFISKKRQEFQLKQYNKEFINDTSSFRTIGEEEAALNAAQQSRTSTTINGKLANFNVWTSTLKRTIETAHYFPRDEFYFKSFKILNDLGCGAYDSVTEEDFRYLHSDDYFESLENKLSYRYPGLGGESYLDVISRLRPIITELERLKDHVLIISHRVIIRVLLCYFMNLNKEMLTELDVQHNYVYCIEPKPYGLDLNVWQYDHVTDMFIEVDVGDIMKRKRKRGSLVMNDVEKLRKLLLRHKLSYDSDDAMSTEHSVSGTDTTDESEYESESETNSDLVRKRPTPSADKFSNYLCERSDSQAYEFCRNSYADLKALGFNPLQPTAVTNGNSVSNAYSNLPTVPTSTSVTSMLSLGSLPSGASLTSLSGLPNIRKNLKGSSSDLRAQAVQATNVSLPILSPGTSATNLVSPSGTVTPAITLSRKNSLKHIKKPSIDWDIFDPNMEFEETPTTQLQSQSQLQPQSPSHTQSTSQLLNNGFARHNTGPTFNAVQRINSASSGASNASNSAVMESEVDMIMGNPVLLNKLKERMKAEKIQL